MSIGGPHEVLPSHGPKRTSPSSPIVNHGASPNSILIPNSRSAN